MTFVGLGHGLVTAGGVASHEPGDAGHCRLWDEKDSNVWPGVSGADILTAMREKPARSVHPCENSYRSTNRPPNVGPVT